MNVMIKLINRNHMIFFSFILYHFLFKVWIIQKFTILCVKSHLVHGIKAWLFVAILWFWTFYLVFLRAIFCVANLLKSSVMKTKNIFSTIKGTHTYILKLTRKFKWIYFRVSLFLLLLALLATLAFSERIWTRPRSNKSLELELDFHFAFLKLTFMCYTEILTGRKF